MFPGPSNGLNLTKIIEGISRSLNIANQIIPLYEQTKPMIQNARKAFSVLKEINLPKSPNTNSVNSSQVLSSSNKKTITQSNSLINNPRFFK